MKRKLAVVCVLTSLSTRFARHKETGHLDATSRRASHSEQGHRNERI